MWGYVAILVITWLISYALAPKPQVQKPASMDDLNIPNAEEGKEIPVVFGTVLLRSPTVVWHGDLKTKAIRAKQGKK